jgi:hypothetical protein
VDVRPRRTDVSPIPFLPPFKTTEVRPGPHPFAILHGPASVGKAPGISAVFDVNPAAELATTIRSYPDVGRWEPQLEWFLQEDFARLRGLRRQVCLVSPNPRAGSVSSGRVLSLARSSSIESADRRRAILARRGSTAARRSSTITCVRCAGSSSISARSSARHTGRNRPSRPRRRDRGRRPGCPRAARSRLSRSDGSLYPPRWSTFQPAQVVHFSTGLDGGRVGPRLEIGCANRSWEEQDAAFYASAR